MSNHKTIQRYLPLVQLADGRIAADAQVRAWLIAHGRYPRWRPAQVYSPRYLRWGCDQRLRRQQIFELLEFQNWKCVGPACGKPIGIHGNHRHHVAYNDRVGGGEEVSDLMLVHPTCHRRLHERAEHEDWRQLTLQTCGCKAA